MVAELIPISAMTRMRYKSIKHTSFYTVVTMGGEKQFRVV
jgi:hypothetical protein